MQAGRCCRISLTGYSPFNHFRPLALSGLGTSCRLAPATVGAKQEQVSGGTLLELRTRLLLVLSPLYPHRVQGLYHTA